MTMSPIIAQEGVTSANALDDVVDFFSRNVIQDLQADADTVHPIVQVDSIRFLYSFRNQASLLLLPFHFGAYPSSRQNSSFLSFHFSHVLPLMYAAIHMPRRLSSESSSLNATLCYCEQRCALHHFSAKCLPSFGEEDTAPEIPDVVPSRIWSFSNA